MIIGLVESLSAGYLDARLGGGIGTVWRPSLVLIAVLVRSAGADCSVGHIFDACIAIDRVT